MNESGTCRKSVLWQYFEKTSDKRAQCTFCDEVYSYQTTTSNLASHLKRKHPQAYINMKGQEEIKEAENGSDDGKQKVIYLVAETPTSPVSKESLTKDTDVGSRHRRSSFFKRKLQDSRNSEGMKERSLIQQLTKEKIALTEVQKELVEKELEEKTIKVMLLQEDLEHRKHMQELEKEEMRLKIDLLKAKLAKESMVPGSNIVIMPTE